jgi:hypothetical protein
LRGGHAGSSCSILAEPAEARRQMPFIEI